MFLIGQYDSPFVRRVAIAMKLYEIPFEHRQWSTFSDAELIAAFNPLRRVPVLVLDTGEALIESAAILDYLDECAGQEKAMAAAQGETRRKQLRLCALATGLGDKAVSLVYERVLRKDQLKLWVDRCSVQITGVLEVLERERAAVEAPYFCGDNLSHVDIVVACVLRFTSEAHEHLFDDRRYPALAKHAYACESLRAFKETIQPLVPPRGQESRS